MKKKLIKIAIISGIVVFLVIAFFLFILFGWKYLCGWLGLGFGASVGLFRKRKSYMEVNNILTDVERKNEKVNGHDNSAIRDAFNSIGGSENKRN